MRHGDLQGRSGKGFKARAFCVLAALSAAAFSGGCYQDRVVRQVTPMPPEPRADDATQLRDWSQSVAFYRSGTVQAWPTRWYFATYPDQETPLDYLLDPLKFVVQAATLPVTLVLEPPSEKVYYEGDVVPPTYAAMPPLPPRPGVNPADPYPDPLGQPRPPRVPGPPIDKRRVKMQRTSEQNTAPDSTAPATTAPDTAPAPTTQDKAPTSAAPEATSPAPVPPAPGARPTEPGKEAVPPAPEPNK